MPDDIESIVRKLLAEITDRLSASTGKHRGEDSAWIHR
jgi:hypothetical protein